MPRLGQKKKRAEVPLGVPPSELFERAPLWVALALLLFLSSNFLLSGWHSALSAEWDWDFYWTAREMLRRIWVSGGALNPWSAHFCGGFPLLDSTEIPVLSPFLAFWALLGPVPGVKLEFVVILAIGLVGMFRAIGAAAPESPRWVRAIVALQFSVSGFLLMHLNAGHFSFAPFALFPWIVFGLLTGDMIPIALTLAAGPILGANNVFMHSILFTLAAGVFRPRLFPLIVKSGVWAGFLSAPLILYQMMGFADAKGLKWDPSQHHELPQTVGKLFGFLTNPSRELWQCDVDCNWEYASYIGPVVLVLGTVGLVWAAIKSRAMRPWAFVSLVFFLIALGPFAPWAPFRVFWDLPLLSRLEINTRFLFDFSVPVFIGFAWVLALLWQKGRAFQAASVVLALAAAVPALIYAKAMFDLPGEGKVLEDLRGKDTDVQGMIWPQDFRTGRYEALRSKTGLAACHMSSSKHSYPGKIQLGRGPVLIAPAGSDAHFDDRYWRISWAPDQETARGGGPYYWVLNQNYSRHFEAECLEDPSIHPLIQSQEDLLRMELPPGTHVDAGKRYTFVIKHGAPWTLVGAYGIGLAAWGIFLGRLWVRKSSRRRAA